MVYDDDTGKRPGFEIPPVGAGGARQVIPPTADQRQIVALADQNPGWGPAELARHLNANSNKNYTADVITFVLQDARRGNRDRG